ncbi:MAG: type I DNA topoisomerase [Patescibacteria group bacterium]|nr:type I DNA topoisomerase [Patescibacteria group bacterium]
MSLIIVESPTKARTFNRILKAKGKDGEYTVFATMGHFRDLPATSMAIDFDHKFKPQYEIMEGKVKVYNQLQKLKKEHKEVIFATDPDREGESISYHAALILGYLEEEWPEIRKREGIDLKRIVFHEITPKALEDALAHPEELRINLVKAQQARRILDRIVGYELSPLLWKKTGKNWLSAGRVQTVALRLVVEREKEVKAFETESYYQIYGEFIDNSLPFTAKLIRYQGKPFEIKTKINLFDGEYEYTRTSITGSNVKEIETALKTDTYHVSDLLEETIERFPPPPLTTSLLQQDSYQRFGFPSKLTMKIAQQLYEKGLITYHRTDSFNLSAQFVFRAKDYITENYGPEYALEKPRGYKTKSRLAQEAHEAIRPTRLDQDKEKIKKLASNQLKVYQLIFERALATQMKEASIKKTTVTIAGTKGYEFQAEHQQVIFDGFLKILQPGFIEKNSSPATFRNGVAISLNSLDVQENQTKHPPRYNEASLIKTLEEKGIGRPSTYASILSLIIDKHYIEREGRYLIPTKVGEGISDYLAKSFPDLFDLSFTAQMEENLDQIADGSMDMIRVLTDFYEPFKSELELRKKDTSKIDVDEKISDPCPECGGELTIKYSKWGKFYACANYPKCRYIRSIPKYVPNSKCGKCGSLMVSRYSKSGKKFFGCANYPECDYVAWSLAQARNPEKFTEQIAAAEAKKAEMKANGTFELKKPVKKTSASKATTKKRTTKKHASKRSTTRKASAAKTSSKSRTTDKRIT